ncbi:ABC transporter substrate-binding protein [Bifidobacterium sp. CP2]|uniref:peptide ABC transporter substrate-binding protein n=1 Tax=Bifidobacterium sp. CP2 TaxID=2809025 RepID=UPI001BDBB26C|nr:ABC transporter substrate-binding protein [Bifidobacterium sp. CP2]MBT1182426.1 ABC transporter substrate-binding protein [Bifidobacterium sp. CP2]
MRIRKRITAAIAATLGIGLLLAGCGQVGDTAADTAEQDGKAAVITVNNVEPASGLIPSDTNDMAGWKVVTQLFEGLVTFSSTGKLIYADAESITPNADASQYTITLRDGLEFSDGEKITAETYAKSWSFAANAANGQMGAAIFSTIKGYDQLQDENGDKNAQLSGLKVIDDKTLQVTLAAPDSSFDYKVGDVAFLPLPSSAYKDIKAFGEKPVGNGPYQFESWTHDGEIKLTPNPKYTGPRTPKNGGVTFKLYTNLDSAYADLTAGNLDVLDSIPSSALATYKSERSIQAFSKAGPGFKAFTIPSGLKHFTGEEGRLRRAAISYAVNRDRIVDKVLRGTATAATDFTAPSIAGYSKTLSGSDVLSYNADKAKELWKKADAISPWDGTFRLAYASDSGSKQWVDAIVNSIKNALGIDAQSYPFPTQKDFSGAVHDRTINAAFTQGLQSDYPHPEGYLVQAYDSAYADGKGLNNGDYKSSEFDGLIDEAAKQTTLDGSVKYYRQAEEVLLKDLPVIPLWYGNVSAGAGKGVKNVKFNYMGLPEYQNLVK